MRLALSLIAVGVSALLTVAMLFTAGWVRPPILSTQSGFRGTGMEQHITPAALAVLKAANAVPDPLDPAPAGGSRAVDDYKNVKVLTDLSTEQFNRLMLAITTWVAPEQGCAYCHNVENLADDGLYTKVVARRMLQMTRQINGDWTKHVAATGVTCYTCHRGQPVPANIWFNHSGPAEAQGFAASRQGQNVATAVAGDSSLPYTALDTLLVGGPLGKNDNIRVAGNTALPVGPGRSIKDAETTYSLMIHMSGALGVNCTFCHNTQSFRNWAESTPQRVTAWYGINMVRSLNDDYLIPLKTTLPPNRLGPLGDSPKVNCATCHQGVNKPLYGASMLKDYPELAGVHAQTQ
jgi:photosynthetic reaction center cytochrome c subunit